MRRVVREPKRWDRIVELAGMRGATLPKQPDAKALDGFLLAERKANPLGFPDLSLSIIKLMGAGEYVLEGLDVGHTLRVKLVRTNVERGFIDFKSKSGKCAEKARVKINKEE